MRWRLAGEQDEFWPAYTDILMVTSLILILLLVTFVIVRQDDHIRQEQERRKETLRKAFEQAMAPEISRNLVHLSSPPGERQLISFSDQLLFGPGDASLSRPEGLASLGKVAKLLRGFQKEPSLFETIKVNGHTDEDAIATAQYPSNWHLSGARATSVVYFFVQGGIQPVRLSATGFAEFRPVDGQGKSITDKAKKRRIEIELLYPEAWISASELANRRKSP